MNLSKMSRLSCVWLMAFLISPLPNVAFAEMAYSAQADMVSAQQVLSEMNHEQKELSVRDYFSDTAVQDELLKRGVSPDEVQARLASLSQTELNMLSGQIQEARAGGDILVTVLLIVLIVFLIKRI